MLSMNKEMENKKQKARLALILKTGKLRLWFFFPATRHYCYLTEAGDYGHKYNPAEFCQMFHIDDIEGMSATIYDICDGKQDSAKIVMRSREAREEDCRRYEVSISVMSRNDNGQPAMLMGIEHDVTEEHRRQERIRQLLMRYHTIFNSSMLDMLYYDKNGVLIDLNDRTCNTFNVKRREDVLDGSFRLENNPFYSQIPLGEKMENSHTGCIVDFNELTDPVYQLDELGLKGKMYYESTINPIRNEKGELEGIYMAGHNISEKVESFHRQQNGVRQLQQGTESIEQYIANIDYALSVSHVQMVNYYPHAYTFEIINRETHSKLRMSQLRCIRLATLRFRRTVNSVLNRMDHLTKHGITQAIETEIRDKKGRQIWLLFNMVPMLDAEGNVERYFGMFRDITDLVETEQRLAIETKKAQETEVLKQAFLTNMSYEIRTPLNNIIGFAGLFTCEHDESDEPFFVEQIKQYTNELLLLVNDILYISRLDANMEEYKKESVDFALLFESQCQTGLNGIKTGVQPIIRRPYSSMVVDIDVKHVSMIIQRLCGLSCLSTTQGEITASYEYHRGELTIHIEDTGTGFTDKEKDHLFDHFSRNEKGQMVGSGLDLPIVQLLTHQMGGTIDIQSDYGKGTSVWVSIPCTATAMERS
jgi:signal transduction histidine kinase